MPRLVTFLALLCVPGLAAQTRQPLKSAQTAAATIRQLRAIGVPRATDGTASMPANVPPLLLQLNSQLGTLLVDILNDHTRHAVASEEEVFAELTAAGWQEIPANKWNAYGEIRSIKFDWKVGYEPGILIASTQLWLPTDRSQDPDSTLYIFEGRARRWDLVLAQDADFDPFETSDSSGMQYQLSPPDSSGHWFLAVAHAPPSSFRGSRPLHYTILRPGRSADHPKVLLDRREPLISLSEPAYELRVETDWAALTRRKVRHLDGEPGISISRYELVGESARRVHPLALSPEDFLDEWAQLGWDDARTWTKDSDAENLEHWHEMLKNLAFESVEIESVATCSNHDGAESTWLVSLEIDQRLNSSVKETTVFSSIIQRDGVLYVDSIRTTRTAGCAQGTRPETNLTGDLPQW